MISVLILTKDEEKNISACIESVSWSDDIHVLDSFSADNTVEMAQNAGAIVTQRKFDNWAAHQNWALSNIPFKHQWLLYIDADERISSDLKDNLLRLDLENTDYSAFSIRRRDFSWSGKWLRHVQMSAYYIRLFRPNRMKYERLVNPISIVKGKTGSLPGYLDHFPFSKGYAHWWKRHVDYANLEAQIRMEDRAGHRQFSMWKALFSKDFHEKRRHQKGIFYKLPVRPLIKFVYLSIWKLGFLDGSDGIRYALMQSIYEYFIVLRTREMSGSAKSPN